MMQSKRRSRRSGKRAHGPLLEPGVRTPRAAELRIEVEVVGVRVAREDGVGDQDCDIAPATPGIETIIHLYRHVAAGIQVKTGLSPASVFATAS